MKGRRAYVKSLCKRIGSAVVAALMAMPFAAPATALADGETDEEGSALPASTLTDTTADGQTNTWQVESERKQGSVQIEMAEVPENVTVTLLTKVTNLASGENFTWDEFDVQGHLEVGHYVRIWAESNDLAVDIGGMDVDGGSDVTDVYYGLNEDASGFEKVNDGKVDITMPYLPSAVAGLATGTQVYMMQIVEGIGTDSSTMSRPC